MFGYTYYHCDQSGSSDYVQETPTPTRTKKVEEMHERHLTNKRDEELYDLWYLHQPIVILNRGLKDDMPIYFNEEAHEFNMIFQLVTIKEMLTSKTLPTCSS